MYSLSPTPSGVQGNPVLLPLLLLLVMYSRDRCEESESGDGGKGESAGIDIGGLIMDIAIIASCAGRWGFDC